MPLYPRHGAYFTTYFCNKINKHIGGIFVLCMVEFSKISKRAITFIREMRVGEQSRVIYFAPNIFVPHKEFILYKNYHLSNYFRKIQMLLYS